MKKQVFLWDFMENAVGVFRISQVLQPAIEDEFIAFSDEKNLDDDLKFSVQDEKMRLAGAILIPNKEIYRKALSTDDTEGYAMFTEEAVERAMMSFKKNNDMFSINVQHKEQKSPSYLFMDWIVYDPETDISKTVFGKQVPKGTWFGVMQVTDKNYWNDTIKTGKVRGFSVEIMPNSVTQKKLLNMENQINLASATLADGTVIYYDGEIAVGTAIFIDEEMTKPAPDGKHTDGDGNTIVTVEGKVTEVIPVEVSAEAEKAAEEVAVVEAPNMDNFATKEEVTAIVADLVTRLDALEKKLIETEEKKDELEKEVKELKSEKPGSKSFVLAKDKQKSENVNSNKETLSFSQNMKKVYQELGKL